MNAARAFAAALAIAAAVVELFPRYEKEDVNVEEVEAAAVGRAAPAEAALDMEGTEALEVDPNNKSAALPPEEYFL